MKKITLTVNEVALLLGVSTTTIYTMVREANSTQSNSSKNCISS